MNHYPMPSCGCPVCGFEIDGATNLSEEGSAPDPGDVSLCIACGAYLCFEADLSLRLLTDDELLALPADILQRLQQAEIARRDLFALYRREGKRVPQRRR